MTGPPVQENDDLLEDIPTIAQLPTGGGKKKAAKKTKKKTAPKATKAKEEVEPAPPEKVAQEPPEALESGDLVPSEPLVTSDLLAPSQLGGKDFKFRWDEFMGAMSAETRDRIWEQGIADMEALLKTPEDDLLTPNGCLMRANVEEVKLWLGQNGKSLLSVKSIPKGSMGSSTTVIVATRMGDGDLYRRQAKLDKHNARRKTK